MFNGAWGYKAFFMLKWIEHEISTTHKSKKDGKDQGRGITMPP